MKTPTCSSLLKGSVLGILVSAAQLQAAVVWNEGISGDLSNNQLAPAFVVVGGGVNSVIGSVNGATDSQDWLTFTVPVGFQLSSVVLFSYVSGDLQGFTGFCSGASFVGNVFVPGSYLGYAHYGISASNGPELPPNVVGINILPAMGLNGPGQTGAGAGGFTPPLPSGSYTFLIQQLGGPSTYQFDYGITPVPEPAAFALLVLGCGAFSLRRRAK